MTENKSMESLEELYSDDGIYGDFTYGSPTCCRD